LDHSIDRATGRACIPWTADEDSKLKNSVQIHGGKHWAAITAVIPGRSSGQCHHRWNDAFDPKDILDPSIDRAAGRADEWSEDEHIKLKDAVQAHGGNNWGLASALVPGRSKSQCYNKWKYSLDPSSDRATGPTGKWSVDEATS
jgi:hypothetical protein